MPICTSPLSTTVDASHPSRRSFVSTSYTLIARMGNSARSILSRIGSIPQSNSWLPRVIDAKLSSFIHSVMMLPFVSPLSQLPCHISPAERKIVFCVFAMFLRYVVISSTPGCSSLSSNFPCISLML